MKISLFIYLFIYLIMRYDPLFVKLWTNLVATSALACLADLHNNVQFSLFDVDHSIKVIIGDVSLELQAMVFPLTQILWPQLVFNFHPILMKLS